MEYKTNTLTNTKDAILRLVDLLLLNRMTFLKTYEKYTLAIYFKSAPGELYSTLEQFNASKWITFLGRKVKETTWNNKKIYALKKGIDIDLNWVHTKKGTIVTIDHESYPKQLSEMPDPPIVLFIRGQNNTLLHRNVAIVGTRNPDPLGKDAAFKLGYTLTGRGINVVSGFAYGIDICAHRGNLHYYNVLKKEYQHTKEEVSCDKRQTITNHLGVPIVVLGTPIDYIYPRFHIQFAQQVLNFGGLIISEYPPSSEMLKSNFISRNRIISGFCKDIIIVQAPYKSGALATAEFALDQGRNVWVHSCGLSEKFGGTLQLYKNGAMVIDWQIN